MNTSTDSSDYKKKEHRFDEGRRWMTGPHRAMKIVGMTILGIFAAAVFALVFGILVMWLWNSLMPAIFGLGRISYWQAFGLIILSKLLFGSFGHHAHHRHHHDRWGHKEFGHHGKRGACRDYLHWKMKHHFHKHDDSWGENSDDDDLWKPKGSYRNWKYYEQYWKDKGKADFEAYIDKIEGDNDKKTGSV